MTKDQKTTEITEADASDVEKDVADTEGVADVDLESDAEISEPDPTDDTDDQDETDLSEEEVSEEATDAQDDDIPEDNQNDDTAADEVSETPAPVAEKSTSATPLILGGAVAALIGFGVSYVIPEGWPMGAGTDAEISARIDTQAEQISDLTSRLDGLNVNDPDAAIAPVEAWVKEVTDQLQDSLNNVQEQLTALDQRVETLEKRPITGDSASDDAVAAYNRDVGELRDQLEAQRSEIEAILADAQNRSQEAVANTRVAQANGAISAVSQALTKGAGFSEHLTTLNALGVDIPTALSENAAGVMTLATLQGNFTDPARDALGASLQTNVEDGSVSRLGGFLRRQLGMRSLTPREGNDANAVLSRAEFALQEGRISDTLSELAGLPESGQALMADWVAQATTYENVTQALSELNSAVSSGALATE
ncbi:COG4223 family protein [Halocynthiibacter sp.]|uniref:COG4223 family protein n=1 Tax=Halocynthiibacter sp. TaxID=1979210 RepID=UPI003C35F89B